MEVTLSNGQTLPFKTCTHGDYIKFLAKGQEARQANEGKDLSIAAVNEINKFGILQLLSPDVTVTSEDLDNLSVADFALLNTTAQSLYFPAKPDEEKKD